MGLPADGIARDELEFDDEDDEECISDQEKSINVVDLGSLQSEMVFLGNLDILKDMAISEREGKLLELSRVHQWESEDAQLGTLGGVYLDLDLRSLRGGEEKYF